MIEKMPPEHPVVIHLNHNYEKIEYNQLEVNLAKSKLRLWQLQQELGPLEYEIRQLENEIRARQNIQDLERERKPFVKDYYWQV